MDDSILYHPTVEETTVNLISISVRRTNGAKIKDIVIAGYGYESVRTWAINHLEKVGTFPTPCVIQSHAYQHGDGWYQLESISIPALGD